jgi:hypothetical protein
MKILITGITKLQCVENFYLNQELKVVPSELALVSSLREMGHDVTQKIVTWGEDLDSYDRIITYLSPTNAFAALYTDGALWTLKRKDTLVAVDDWAFHIIYTNGSNPATRARKWIGGKTGLLRQLNNAPASQEEIDEVHYDWANNRKMLLPAFSGGDLSLMFDFMYRSKRWSEWMNTQSTELFSYDPNPWLPLRVCNRASIEPIERKKEWVVAGLSKGNRAYMNRWKPTLPVVELGGKGENGFRMTEPDAVHWFGERHLHAMPGYKHAGSGWWRSRPSQLAGHKVVTYCDPREGAIYGPSWVIDNPMMLEQMSPKELVELGERQSEEFFYRHPIGENGKQAGVDSLTKFLK